MGGLVPVLVVIAYAIAAAVVVMVVALVRRRPEPSPSVAAEAARWHAGLVNVLSLTFLVGGLLGGSTFVARLPASPAQGLYLGLVPTAAGLAFAVILGAGELTWPRPSGAVRRAPLARRTARDVAPAWLVLLARGWAALAVVTLVTCGVAADGGRQLSRTVTDGSVSAGPFPGWFYGVPLLASVTIVVFATEGVLRLIARRPAVSGASPEWDLALRRLSAHRLLRGAQLVLGLTAAGVILIAGLALRTVGAGGEANGVSTASVGYAATAIVVLVLGLAVGLVSAAITLAPGIPATSRRRRADAVA